MTGMVWIGGSPGAGKSTIARQFARARDLPLHPVDLWTYDHLARMPVFRSLVEEVTETPEAAADVFVKISRARLEGLLERDAILPGRVREEAAAAGLPLVEMSADPDWAAIVATVETILGQLPRLRAGDELSGQRRIENRAACRQLRLWRADRGFAELPRFPFACECGESGCDLTFVGTPGEYEARAGGQLQADGHLNRR